MGWNNGASHRWGSWKVAVKCRLRVILVLIPGNGLLTREKRNARCESAKPCTAQISTRSYLEQQ